MGFTQFDKVWISCWKYSHNNIILKPFYWYTIWCKYWQNLIITITANSVVKRKNVSKEDFLDFWHLMTALSKVIIKEIWNISLESFSQFYMKTTAMSTSSIFIGILILSLSTGFQKVCWRHHSLLLHEKSNFLLWSFLCIPEEVCGSRFH